MRIANEILMFLRSQKKTSKEVFLNDPIGVDKEGNKITLEDKLRDEDFKLDEFVGKKIQVNQLYELIDKLLNEREKAVIQLRYGLVTGEEITQRETACLLNISRSYVSRIEKKALRKLCKEMSADGE